jgi:hypothetical protein
MVALMSTREFGCFFCAGKSQDKDGICPSCGEQINIGSLLVEESIDEYQPREIIGRGFYGWTIKVESSLSFRLFALKLIPLHRLPSQSLTADEARALATCSPHRNIAAFWRRFATSIRLHTPSGNHDVEAMGLLFEYVEEAQPFSELLVDRSVSFSRKDVCDILTGIASGVARMHSKGLWHDDLHDDNILVRRVSADENLSEQFEAKLIDFGSARPFTPDQQERGERGDYHYLAKHIYALTNRFETDFRGRTTPLDRAFAGRLRRLAQRICDPDVGRRTIAPADLVKDIRFAYNESAKSSEFLTFSEMKKRSAISFKEPLENTNALSLAPQDIALLFRDGLHWTSRLEKTEPVIVVGPRGCGKTMLLRYLSTLSQARPHRNEDSPEQVRVRLESENYIGFLVSAGQFRTPFMRSSYKKLESMDSTRAEEFCREYISSVFVLEILRTILWLKSEKLASISDQDIDILHSTVADFTSDLPNEPANKRKNRELEDFVEMLERYAGDLSNLSDPEGYIPSKLSRDDVLNVVAKALKASSWVGTREVWFLLDDYSVTVLPPFAQRSYNSVLFNLPSSYRLKVSSEGDGPILEDSLSRKYKEGRELTKVHLGEVYFSATEQKGKEFFEQILEARFEEVGKGSLTDIHKILFEHADLEHFGEYICRKKRPGLTQFYGFGLLCKLCSGDVSFIIELLDALVKGQWGEAASPLSAAKQDDIIKSFAQRQLADLKQITERGTALYLFAERVGGLLKKYLLASDPKKDPDERLRIEIEGPEQLSSEAQQMDHALLRHSVLVEGGVGKSRGGLPTRRLYFRRLFAPCFPFSPSRKGCIALTVREYQEWLLNPESIPQDVRKNKRKSPQREGLFGDSN